MHILLQEIWENNSWNNDYRNTYNYDTNSTTSLGEEWIGGAWVNDRRFTSTYDANGSLLIYLYEVWYNEWLNDSRYTYTYDQNGNRLTELSEDGLTGTWINEYRIAYTYENNNIISELKEVWVNESWYNEWRSGYVYENGNSVRGESYDWYNGAWLTAKGGLHIYYNNMNENIPFICKFVDISYDMFTGINEQPVNNIQYSLGNNYPNPFNPSTTINYSIASYSKVTIKVFGLLGNEVAALIDEDKSAGNYQVTWNAAYLPGGVYFYQLKTDSFIQTKKMILLK
jgi:hypothetical protein